MKPNSSHGAAIALSVLVAAGGAGAIELNRGAGAPGSAGPYAANATTTVAGLVTTIDGKAGHLVLDGKRRFDFAPAVLVVRRPNNQGGTLRLADVRAGTRVSLTVVRKNPNSPWVVSEASIAP